MHLKYHYNIKIAIVLENMLPIKVHYYNNFLIISELQINLFCYYFHNHGHHPHATNYDFNFIDQQGTKQTVIGRNIKVTQE